MNDMAFNALCVVCFLTLLITAVDMSEFYNYKQERKNWDLDIEKRVDKLELAVYNKEEERES